MTLPAPLRFDGKTVLVTGASSGIGRACAVLISQLGGNVIASGRDQARLDQTLSMLEGHNHSAAVYDLKEVKGISDWILGLASQHGPIDGLIHMAGILISRPLNISHNETVQDLFDININATIGLVRGFRQKKVRNSPSSIVLAASVAGMVGDAGLSIYSASKGAIISLTKSLAIELAREKIRVNCVSPSIVETPMTATLHTNHTPDQLDSIEARHPLGFGQPEDVAYSVAFLLSDAARWITGTNMVIDGGYSAQ